MTTLVKVLRFLQSENALEPHLHRRVELSQQELSVDSAQRSRFIAIGVVALCSAIATLSLISFLLYRFIFWKRYYKQPLVENQYVFLIFNLLLVDFQQALGFMMCLVWAAKGKVEYHTAACVLQGWLVQTADPGSGLFVLAIAVHTGAAVLRGRQLSFPAFLCCVIALWGFIITLGVIAVGLYGGDTFVVSEAGWCWISDAHETERLWGHYLFIFLAEFGTVILYGIIFFYLRRQIAQSSTLRQNQTDKLKRLNRVVLYMVIYPFAYLILSLPLAAGRMSTARNIIPSKTYFSVAGSMMALSGIVDVAVYTITRKHLISDSDLSNSDRAYPQGKYNTHQTHISTTRGARRSLLIPSRFRRGLQGMRVLSENDDSSADNIIRRGDMELSQTKGAVYQETTIEITHEPAEMPEGSSPKQWDFGSAPERN